MTSLQTIRRAATVAVAAGAMVGVAATFAYAHVTVSPQEVAKGSYARLDFRVPNESDTESTTKVEVFLPEDAPIASVRTAPVAGWTAQLTSRTLDEPIEAHGRTLTEVVSQITWTATPGAEIKSGEFLEFPVTMGRMPEDVDQLVFKALQTYSDGTIVRWIEVPSSEDPDPAHPAPILKLGDAAPEPDLHETAAQQPSTPAAVASGTDGVKNGGIPGWAGLTVGALGLLVALLALWRTRRSGAAES